MHIRHLLTILFALCLSSCTITRAVKYGNAAVDDYTVFEQDIIHNGTNRFDFIPKGGTTTLDTLKLNIYRAKTDTLLHLTISEVMDYFTNTPSAALIIQDDKVIQPQ